MGTKTRLRLPRTPFLDAVRKSELLTPDDLVAFFTRHDPDMGSATDPVKLATLLVQKKLLTKFQAMNLLNGRTQGFTLGRYKILNGIRQDRVGMVFHAQDTSNGRQVSVKVLPTDRTNDPVILEAFLKEVRAAALVEHPNVARILDIGVANGTRFVVSEFVPTATLDKVLADKGPLPPDVVIRAAAQVAVALKYAHARDLLHRDIKPANIAILPGGAVKLIDLGMTHMLENPWKQVTRRIKTQEYADEIAHVAPEQAWGSEPDARSDFYCLGSTVYMLLTGQPPFSGTAAESMASRQVEGVPPPSLVRPDVPREIDAIVQKLACREPHLRYQSADELLVAVHPWLPINQWVSLGIDPERFKPKAAKAVEPAKGGGLFEKIRKLFGA